jgi:hypothetical protein
MLSKTARTTLLSPRQISMSLITMTTMMMTTAKRPNSMMSNWASTPTTMTMSQTLTMMSLITTTTMMTTTTTMTTSQ